MHDVLARPSPQLPLERFLTPNWTEDANNLYARMHIDDLNMSWEGLSLAETREAIARFLVRHTTRNAERTSSSSTTGNMDQEVESDHEGSRE